MREISGQEPISEKEGIIPGNAQDGSAHKKKPGISRALSEN